NKRIAFQLFRIPKEKHLRTPLAQCEMPRRDKSVSAVVPLAAEDIDPPGWKIRACLQYFLRHEAPRVFHQYKGGNMVDLRAEPVHLCHLTSLQDFHAECLSPGRSLGRE